MCNMPLEGQKRALVSLELELKMAVSCHVCTRTELGSFVEKLIFLTAESSLQSQVFLPSVMFTEPLENMI